MKLVKACIALVAFTAFFVVPSVASAVKLTAPTGTLYSGNVIATNINHAQTATQTVMTTGIGNLVCGTATITGKVVKAEGASVEGDITTANFAGTHGVTTTGPCAGTGLLGSHITPTPSHTSDELKSLPWCLRAGAEDTFTVRGGKCSEAARPLTFTLHGAITCNYQANSVEGTYTTHSAGATATIKDQVFHRFDSSGFCPSTGSLDMAFTLSADTIGETDSEHVYIDA